MPEPIKNSCMIETYKNLSVKISLFMCNFAFDGKNDMEYNYLIG